MPLTFRAISEAEPGPKWSGLFAEYRDAYLTFIETLVHGVASGPLITSIRRATTR